MLIDTGKPAINPLNGVFLTDLVGGAMDAAHDAAYNLHGVRTDENAALYDASFDSALAAIIRLKITQPARDNTRRRIWWCFHEPLAVMAQRSPDIHDDLVAQFLERLTTP